MGDWNQLQGVLEVPLPDPPENTQYPEQWKRGKLQLSRQVDGEVKAAFEDWLSNNALDRLFRQRHILSDEQYDEAWERYEAHVSGGTFSWGGNAFRQSLKQVPGVIALTTILANRAGEADVDEGCVLEMMEAGAPIPDCVKKLLDATPNFFSPAVRARHSNQRGSGRSSPTNRGA